MKSSEEAEFGTVLLDLDVEDITEPFRKEFESVSEIFETDYFEKFCLYLTLYNNFIYENGDELPRRISCINPITDFFFVLLMVACEHNEETIKDIELFFNFWLEFLNENVDWLDKISENEKYPGHLASKRFEIMLKQILSDDE